LIRREDAQPALLELEGVTKVFPNGTVALREVDFRLAQGSVHGLVGSNGAGKSTMIRIVSGADRPTDGRVVLRGEPVHHWAPGTARAAGIGTVYQNVPLVPTLSVLENVFLGQGAAAARVPLIAQLDRYLELEALLGISIDPWTKVESLPIGRRQLLALLQVLALGATLIVLDEPTASLSRTERTIIFDVIRRLSSRKGISFIYVSHHLSEVLDLTDTVTILRDGRVASRWATADLDVGTLLREVTGAELAAFERSRDRSRSGGAEPLLEAQGLNTKTGVRDVSFTLRAGEVTGLFGMMGSGRTELLRALYGADPLESGEVRYRGRVLEGGTPGRAAAGIAFLPEDRRRDGLLLNWDVCRNASIVDLGRLGGPLGTLRPVNEVERALTAIDRLSIVTQGPGQPVGTLSGGNQQKVVFAKWIFGDFDVFVLDEPTVGVDVATKAQILALTRDLAAQGGSVLINSSEPDELLAVADRILVLRGGTLVAELEPAQSNENELIAYATGLDRT